MNYVAFDIETTGLNPKYEKIIEIGAVRVRDGAAQDTFSTFVNPGKGLPERIIELTGIHDADVADAPYMDEVLDTFLDFVGDDALLGHNLMFDYSFMKKAAVNQKKTFEKSGIDTLRIARRFLNDVESRSLVFCAGTTIFISRRTGRSMMRWLHMSCTRFWRARSGTGNRTHFSQCRLSTM